MRGNRRAGVFLALSAACVLLFAAAPGLADTFNFSIIDGGVGSVYLTAWQAMQSFDSVRMQVNLSGEDPFLLAPMEVDWIFTDRFHYWAGGFENYPYLDSYGRLIDWAEGYAYYDAAAFEPDGISNLAVGIDYESLLLSFCYLRGNEQHRYVLTAQRVPEPGLLLLLGAGLVALALWGRKLRRRPPGR